MSVMATKSAAIREVPESGPTKPTDLEPHRVALRAANGPAPATRRVRIGGGTNAILCAGLSRDFSPPNTRFGGVLFPFERTGFSFPETGKPNKSIS